MYPVISYQYDTSATLDEFAKEIASASGVSEGETISVLKDFRTLLRKTLLGGRSVNIAGLCRMWNAGHVSVLPIRSRSGLLQSVWRA